MSFPSSVSSVSSVSFVSFVSFDSFDSFASTDNCSICFTPCNEDVLNTQDSNSAIEANDEIYSVAHNGHHGEKHPFHRHCITEWVNTCLKNGTLTIFCPVCKENIDTNSLEENSASLLIEEKSADWQKTIRVFIRDNRNAKLLSVISMVIACVIVDLSNLFDTTGLSERNCVAAAYFSLGCYFYYKS